MPKISSYPDGAPKQDADEFVVARSGANVKLDGDEILSKISRYADGGNLQATDELVLERSGTTYEITGDKLGALTFSDIAPTIANVSAAVNTAYNADVSGLTADRNFVVPSGAAGDRIRLHIETGDDTYYLVVIGDAGVDLGTGAATALMYLQLAGEFVELECESANTWRVVASGFPSGTYSPSFGNTTNVDSTALNGSFFYSRLGSNGEIVHVVGSLQVNATAAAATVVGMDLPLPSNFGDTYDCHGNGSSPNPAILMSIIANAANDQAEANFVTPDGNNHYYRVMFTYRILR